MYGSLTSRRSISGDVDERFVYYPDGKLKFAEGGGMRYDYEYDLMGRLNEKRASGRTLLSYSYDLDGRRTGLSDITGKKTEYHYDLHGRLCEVTDNGIRQALYSYNPDGTVNTLETGSCLKTEYRYDRDKNVTGIRSIANAHKGKNKVKKNL